MVGSWYTFGAGGEGAARLVMSLLAVVEASDVSDWALSEDGGGGCICSEGRGAVAGWA